MTRTKIRENISILLFQLNFHGEEDIEEQVDLFLEDLKGQDATKKAKDEVKSRFMEVVAKLPEIDTIIKEKAEGWSFERLAKADLSILRLAIYEIVFDEKVPNGVAINEAVELARKYGSDNSYRFINGILSSVNKEQRNGD